MDRAAAIEIVSRQGWLSRRPQSFRDALLSLCRLKVYEAGSSLYQAGDPPSGMFGLVTGQWMFRVPPAETLISVASPGYWVGEAVSFGLDQRKQTVAVGQRSIVLHLPQPAFLNLVADADNCRHIAINTAETLFEAITIITNLIQPHSEVRVAQRLLTFLGLHGETQARAFAMSQAELAEMCGLSRQTLGIALSSLIDRGLVAKGYRRLEVLDFEGLRRLATEDERIWR